MINIIATKKKIKKQSKCLKTRKFIALIIILLNELKINVAKFVKMEKKSFNSKKTILIIFYLNVIFFVKIDFFLNCELILLNILKNSYEKILFTQ